MYKTVLKWFPAPNFLKMPAVGLDISDGSARFIEFTNKGNTKKIKRFGKIKLPKDTVLRGVIQDKKKLVEALKPLKTKYKFTFVRVSIIETNSYVFKTKIPYRPNMDRQEIFGSLKFKIEENVPLKANNVVFDFDVISKTKKELTVVVSVLPKNIVEQFIEVFNEIGLVPISFEVEAQAAARASVLEEDKGTYMLVDFRSTRVSISIISEGKVRFTSTLDIGGNDLIDAIKKKFDISSADAKKIKTQEGLLKKDDNEEIFFAMVSTVAALKDEMNKFLNYWNERKGENSDHKKVEKIILCGENGALRGLDDYMALSLGVKTERADVWKNVPLPKYSIPEISLFGSLEYASAIGLAIRTNDKKIID